MKAIRVHYTVKSEYVEQNKRNIKAVMDELMTSPVDGIRYSTYLLPDGQTFMHLNIARDDDALAQFREIASLKKFQKELKASGPITPPKAEDLIVVGAGYELF